MAVGFLGLCNVSHICLAPVSTRFPQSATTPEKHEDLRRNRGAIFAASLLVRVIQPSRELLLLAIGENSSLGAHSPLFPHLPGNAPMYRASVQVLEPLFLQCLPRVNSVLFAPRGGLVY